MHKIVLLDGFTLNPGDLSWRSFELLGELTIYDRTAPEDIISRIGDAEIVFINKTPLDKAIFDVCSSIKWVEILATGYNVVDIKEAKEKRIPICNVPAYGTRSVAQFAFALLLELRHHVGGHSITANNGDWSICPDFCTGSILLSNFRGKQWA